MRHYYTGQEVNPFPASSYRQVMRAFVFEHWHAWQGTAGVLLSDESTKTLRDFPDVDACINWLFLNGAKPAARALNKHAKG